MVVDELRLANWMRTDAARQNRDRPKPISPLASRPKGQRIGQTDRPASEVMAILAAMGPPPRDSTEVID